MSGNIEQRQDNPENKERLARDKSFLRGAGSVAGGAMLGAAVGGPLGAIVGAGIGFFLGQQADRVKYSQEDKNQHN